MSGGSIFHFSKKYTMSKISTEHAKRLIKNYADNKIGQVLKEEDSKGVWFSKEDLMDLLNNPVQGIVPNGLRFYFAAYETLKSDNPPRHAEEENKITLVIFPTGGNDENGNAAKHPYRINPQEMISFDLADKPVAERGLVASLTAVNDGQLCPPPPKPL